MCFILCLILDRVRRQVTKLKMRNCGIVAVAVGIPVARYPPHRSVRALLSAYGSYLRWVAANRSVGQGCNTRGGGSQRVAHGTIRSQGQRRRWLRWSSGVRHSRVNRVRKVPNAPPSGTKTATIALTDTQRKVFSTVSAARNKHGLAAPNGARGQ